MNDPEEWSALALEALMLAPFFMSVGIVTFVLLVDLVAWLLRSFSWLW